MGIQYHSQIVTDKLVFCSDVGNVKSYPGSGTSLYNLAGVTYTGTMTDVTVVDGHFSFNGQNPGSGIAFSNSDISRNPSAYLGQGEGKLTYECWVYKLGDSHGSPARIMSTDASDYTAVTIYKSTDANYPNQLLFYADGAAATLRSGSSNQILVNEWNHIVCTFDMSQTVDNQKIYLNGVEVASNSYDDSTATNGGNIQGTYGENTSRSFAIGSNTEATIALNNGFNGYIDICRIYGKPLSAAEVTQNFDANKARFGL